MSDFNFTKSLEDFGRGRIDLVGGTIKLALCTAAWTAVKATDHHLSDIPGGAIVATITLTGTTFTDAIFDADDPTFPAVLAGSTVTHAVVYLDASPSSGAILLRHVEGPDYTGFPFTTNGLDVNWAWPNDLNKIFSFLG